MLLIARGWSRDHGAREIPYSDLSDAEITDGAVYYRGKTYLEVKKTELPDGGSQEISSIRVSGNAKLLLNGSLRYSSYLVEQKSRDYSI
jgi:hypothetical protein